MPFSNSEKKGQYEFVVLWIKKAVDNWDYTLQNQFESYDRTKTRKQTDLEKVFIITRSHFRHA